MFHIADGMKKEAKFFAKCTLIDSLYKESDKNLFGTNR